MVPRGPEFRNPLAERFANVRIGPLDLNKAYALGDGEQPERAGDQKRNAHRG